MLKQPHFYLKSYCCVCSKYNNLLDLNSYDYDDITYKTKLSISFPDLESTSGNNEIPSYICVSCAENLDDVYKFRLMFLHSRKYTLSYLKELKNVPNNKYNKLHVDILDIKTLLPPDINMCLNTKSVKQEDTSVIIEDKDENLEDCNQYLNVYKEFAREDRPDKLTEIGTNFLGFSQVTNNCRACKGLKKHNQKKARFTCQICRKSYAKDGWLKKHQLSHDLPKKQKCKICFQVVVAKNMDEHKKIHETDECFSCGCQLLPGENHVCKPLNKCVNCNQILTEGKHLCKNFKCVLCCREFKNKGNLTFHIKCHLSVKRYKCSYCGDKFDKREFLDSHIVSEHHVE